MISKLKKFLDVKKIKKTKVKSLARSFFRGDNPKIALMGISWQFLD
ncbi:MAG: hypothetical protein H6Q35_2624 [Proteobacteria bacterium]|nr:hypothetical protein [Pseudomonadota bacterium]